LKIYFSRVEIEQSRFGAIGGDEVGLEVFAAVSTSLSQHPLVAFSRVDRHRRFGDVGTNLSTIRCNKMTRTFFLLCIW
jgi:hypothetical protein